MVARVPRRAASRSASTSSTTTPPRAAAASLLSLRGLDNAGYYQLDAAGTGFTNYNGVGADLAARQAARAGARSSTRSRYWQDALGVDGFRFDLAPVLGNACGPGCFTFDPSAAAADDRASARGRRAAARRRPDRRAVGASSPNSYEVGKFPAGWSEWNDHFRDSLREDQNQAGAVAVTPSELAMRDRAARRTCLRAARAGGVRSTTSSRTTASRCTICTPATRRTTRRRGRTVRATAARRRTTSWDHGGDALAQRQAARTGLALLALARACR